MVPEEERHCQMEGGGLEMMGREMAQTKAETNPRGFMAEKKGGGEPIVRG